ncbi:MAG: 50S ribosomal protein L32 [Bacteroidia bacterium]|jgi:large subunit ribosomal protein L32|nr:50S ribosomal protein L32 [Bacteroidia bacterium]
MPHPKRRWSKTRRDKRRTHHKLDPQAMYVDLQSGEPTLYHRVNLESGYYRGRQVMPGKDE